MISTLLVALLSLPAQAPSFDDARQIHWQRSLDDALLLVRETQRPLFVAINADGESGSERIVRERYRRPDFVASTRAFVCVVGSVFRHNPRDYELDGRRIACPRLGEITCGEHIALEPVLHDEFLLGERIELEGEFVERISPRHALVLPGGEKAWDLFLLFDLTKLDTALAQAAQQWPPLDRATDASAELDVRHRTRLAREELVARREQGGVLTFVSERAAKLRAGEPAFVARGFTDVVRRDLGALDLRDLDDAESVAVFVPQSDESGRQFALLRRRVTDVATAAGERPALAWALRQRKSDPSLAARDEDARNLLPALVELAWDDAGHRTFLVSHAVLADRTTSAIATRALRRAEGRDPEEASLHQPFDVLARVDSRSRDGVAPMRVEKPKTELPPAEQLEQELERADAALAQDRSDAARQVAFGRALLMLARRRMQDRSGDVGLMLEDAQRFLAQTSGAWVDDVALLLDRARVANYLGDFEAQQRHAQAALALGRVDLRGPELNDDMTEAARWLGDACARLLSERASGELEPQLSGMLLGALALTQAALGPESDANDWVSLASFYGALGRTRERFELCCAGLQRFPGNATLRSELLNACWSVGRPELLTERSLALAARYPEFAECAWYAGYALVLHAEWARRGEDADGAIELYARAREQFRRALELEPSFRESSEHYLGMCALGRGFAHLLADRRTQAADALVDAVAQRPAVLTQFDGLEREGLDLIDSVLEWRESGSSPVDALALLERLDAAHPGTDFYARSISDAELREALRAFGRADDAGGNAYLERAIVAGRRAVVAGDNAASRRALAQAATILAERELERGGELQRIARALAEAAPLVGLEGRLPEGSALDRGRLVARARELRARLGAARPVLRSGR